MFSTKLCLLATIVIFCARESLQIVNGDLAEISDYPYAASIQANNVHICGGSIIHSKYILTAAACIESYKSDDLRVRVGSSSFSSDGQLVNISQIIKHPRFNQPEPYLNNVAVLELSPSLLVGQNVAVISTRFDARMTLDKGTIVGWGVIDRQSGLVRPYAPSQHLRSTTQLVIGKWTCENNFLEGWDGSMMFCAGTSLNDNCVLIGEKSIAVHKTRGRIDITLGGLQIVARVIGDNRSIEGDLGNPFVINNILIGMVSKTHTMCGRIPTAYVNITKYSEFINDVLNS